ncbi:tyrosine--tRNA ligase [Pseudomonadota bacterium]
MTKFRSEFLQKLSKKGLIYQSTNLEELDKKLAKEKVTAYIGYDCTASSLHIGSLVTIMVVRLFQQCGHKPIILLGGATTKIGDPTGKDKMRKMLSDEQIKKNMAGIKKSLSKFVKFGKEANDALLVNNHDWIGELSYIDFLRDIGPHFSVNRMLTFESVKQRLSREEHMSLLEFNYMVMQGYDFYHLNKEYGCTLQLCGADQWGNVVSGVELTRRLTHLKNPNKKERYEVYGLSIPLLLTSDGKKMGKTEGGAVWLNEDMFPPYDYFQYFRNAQDGDVGRLLKIFTELPEKTIEELEKLQDQDINEAKKVLAFEATKLCHGQVEAQCALETAEKIFEDNSIEDLPTFETEFPEEGKPLFVLLRESGLCSSGGEARRMITGGGVRIDDEQIKDENYVITGLTDFKLSVGKKKHIRIVEKSNS